MISESVATNALKGSLFCIGSSAVTLVSGFVRTLLLARLLTPTRFGMVALAMFFLSIGDQIRDFGFNQALIHRQEDIASAASTHFVLKLTLAVVVAVVTFAAAPLLRRL